LKKLDGKSFNTSKKPIKGIYSGSFVIQDNDNFNDTPVIFKLCSKDESITKQANSKITVLSKDSVPIIAEVLNDKAVVRTTPDQSRLTPLTKGVRLNITGKTGDDYRFKMGEAMEGWIMNSDIKLLPAGTPYVQSQVTAIEINPDKDNTSIKIPLSQRLPFSIEEIPVPQMVLTLYGATANIDVLPYNPKDCFIKEIKWLQPFADTFQLIIQPNSKQFWGYSYEYKDNTFILNLRKTPEVNFSNPLKDKIITLDPGHGGSETGSTGPTGIPEKTINLAIAEYLKKDLEDLGAKVIMTRNNNNDNPDLYERSAIAIKNNSQILLSIHNNALPDGRNPYIEHGSSAYYYHSQALPLAKCLQQSMVQDLGLKDFGIFWDSLALTRPNEPIAVLVEVGFMINPEEYTLLTDKEFQQKAAKSLQKGFENFFRAYGGVIK